jgi:hypothetical protein
MLTTVYDIFSPSGVRQSTPQSATVVTTPPVCAGVTGTVAHLDGSIEVNWAAATGINAPFEYELFVALGVVSGSSLFQNSNLVTIAPAGTSSKRILTLADQSTYFVKGSTYSIGVRAKDAFANKDSNTVVSTVVALASGDLPSVYQTLATNIQTTETLLAADEVAIAATEVLLAQDHTHLNQDHVNLNQDHVNIASDHANLHQDHLDIAGDHTNLHQDHLDIAGDHTNLNQDHLNLHQDHLDIAATEVLLSSENVAFANSNIDLTGEIATLSGLNSSLESNIAAAAGLGGIDMEVLDGNSIQIEIVDLAEVK